MQPRSELLLWYLLLDIELEDSEMDGVAIGKLIRELDPLGK